MTATLTLILATHNGAAHLPAQLHSFTRQTRLPDLLLVSDDGSGDATRDILADFARTAPFEVRVTDGPCRGYGRNFAALLAQTPAGTGHVALSDQDDIWLPHKLARACARLDDLSGPTLYGSRSWEAADEAAPRRLSRGLTCPPSFRHALARNYAGGNTMVLNRAGADLMRHAARHLVADPVHDWWIYQVITGCGGRAIFDDEPGLIYRQHGANQIGANGGARAILRRARGLAGGQYRTWTDANLANLDALRDRLSPANAALLDDLRALRDRPLVPRTRAFARTGIHRDGTVGRIGMWASVLSGRF